MPERKCPVCATVLPEDFPAAPPEAVIQAAQLVDYAISLGRIRPEERAESVNGAALAIAKLAEMMPAQS